MELDRRTFLKGAVGATGGLLLPACNRDQRQPFDTGRAAPADQRITLRIAGGPFGFPSPFAYVGGPGYVRLSFIYDTLLWTDASGELLPWLASRYERSADGLTYTFELRDARWHDGQPVTPADVAFTFEYFDRQVLSPLIVARPDGVARVTPTGERTVEIQLERPMVTFLRQMAGGVPIIPRHIWSGVSDPVKAQDPQLLVGSGPYRLESHSPEQGSYLFVANDDFFLGPPFVQRIEMVPVEDELRALLAGDIDGGFAPFDGAGPNALAPFRNNPSFEVIEQEAGLAFPLYWDLDPAGPFADKRVRQAIAHAIDRNDIVRRLFGGNATPGNPGFLPPTHNFHVEVEQYPFDLDTANRLLDEAGYSRGEGGVRRRPGGEPLRFGLTIGVTVPPALIDLIVASLRQVGLEIEANAVDLVRMFESKLSGAYDMIVTLYPGPSVPAPGGDPDYLRRIYASQATGFHTAGGYRNPRVDELASRQAVTLDENERRRMITELQQLVANDLPVLPLYYSTFFFAYHKERFDQWYFTPGGGMGPGIPLVYNKHAFVTGQRTGVEVRTAA
ncbi:MAG: ABC transporter substrate-binding protein [Actinomycetota bacterium]|nr:ABC transporter substrate-binding protein [Actinomycetota bacterium]